MFKKSLSVLLAVIICFGTVPATSFLAVTESISSSVTVNVTDEDIKDVAPVATAESDTEVQINDDKEFVESVSQSADTSRRNESTDLADTGATLNYNGLDYTVDKNSKVTITGYTGGGGNLTIPAKINGNTVIGIGTSAFRNNKTITAITIEASLSSMGNYAFSNCSALTKVILKLGTTVLGYYAFGDCSLLESISLPSSIETIGNYAFHKCKKLSSITIPDSVKAIGSYAFFGCESINSLKIGNCVSTIGDRAFKACISLTSVSLPNSVTSIGMEAFGRCASLDTVSIGNNVTEMGNYAFGSNDALTKVIIADGTKVIGKYAFATSYGSSKLNEVRIPASVEVIGDANSANKVYKDNSVFGVGRPVKAVIHGTNNSFAHQFCLANAEACNLEWCNGGDTTPPTASISSTNNVASSQTVTLSMSDDFELSVYYWGTNSSTTSISWTSISGKSKTITTTVSSGSTYYLTVKDTSGNITQTSATFYKTTLDANGGTVSPSSVVTYSGNSFTMPIPTRSGYTFNGWATSSAASSGIYTLTPAKSQYYYASWIGDPTDTTKPTASISSTNNVSSSQTVTLSMNDNVGLAGYYWGTSSSSSPSYTTISGKSYSTDITVSSSGTYYLTVKDTSGNVYQTSSTFYKTTLNANGGSVYPTSITTQSGNSFTFPSPTRSGYTYNGWSTSSTTTSGTTSLKPTGNQTYYAVWTAIPTDTTKPTASISSTNNVSSSQTVTLSMSDNVGLAGYYWGTSSSSSPSYTTISGKNYSTDIAVSSSGTYYLTVKDTSGNVHQISATFYKTTLDANGGSVFPSYVLTKYGDSFDFPTPILKNLDLSGNNPVYSGWSTSSRATSGIYSLTPNANQTYFAVWINSSTDTTKPTASISSTNNVASSQTVTLSMSDDVELTGYYWGTSSSTSPSFTSISGKSYSTEKAVSSEGVYYLTVKDTNGNVYQISATFYKTTLDANGGSVNPPSVLTKFGHSFTFPIPTRSDYSYKGWATSSTATNGVYSLTPTSNQTYYTVWNTESSFILTSTNDVAASQEVSLEINELKNIEGYYWGTDADYSNNQYVKVTYVELGDLYGYTDRWQIVDKPGTYYATLKDNHGISETATITFFKTTLNANGGSVSLSSVLTKSGNSFTMPTPTRTDYSFKGWSTNSAATSGIYSLTPSGNQTYYAIWKAAPSYSITFDPETVSTYVGSDSTVSINFSREGIDHLQFGDNDSNICTASWGDIDYNEGTTSLTFTGKKEGSTSFTIRLINSTGTILYSKKITVNVAINPAYSITFIPSSITTYVGSASTVSINFTGDGIRKLQVVDGDESICTASWGDADLNTGTATLTFTGKKEGSTLFTVQLLKGLSTIVYSKTISVNVISKPTDALINVYNVKGTAGKTVDVPITISNNPGIIGMTLNIAYDTSALELISVKDSEVLGNSSHKPEYSSPYTLSWSNDTATTNFTPNGTIVVLTFMINEGASDGIYPIVASYNYNNYDIYDKDLNKVYFNVNNGSIEVTNYICGDVNSDGTVNNLDRVYLTRYLANWNDYQDIDFNAADVDCNGIVNNLDRVILTRYLANWSDYSTLPYMK